MITLCVLLSLGLVLAAVSLLGFATLSKDRWQFLAAVPVRPDAVAGRWQSVNLTWYGVLIGASMVLSLAVYLFLLASVRVPVGVSAWTAALMLAVCVPASFGVARLVEQRRNVASMGGASFVGFLLAPWVVLGVGALWRRWTGSPIPPDAVLAALAVAYAIGEGTGRLACLSFGCCYGRPLAECPQGVQRMFARWHVAFHAATHKAVYDSGLAAQPLVPIQGVTTIVLSGLALLGIGLFLNGHFLWTLALVTGGSQLWRFGSEFLRADIRGRHRSLSAYQVMSLVGALGYVGFGLLFAGGDGVRPDPLLGLRSLWSPGVILLLQAAGVVAFLRYGISTVTASSVEFRVIPEAVAVSRDTRRPDGQETGAGFFLPSCDAEADRLPPAARAIPCL